MKTMLESKRRRGSEPARITTTLYDLIETMQDDVDVTEDGLVATAVVELFHTGRIAFLRRGRCLRPFRPTLQGLSYS